MRLGVILIVATACGSTSNPQPAATLKSQPPTEPTCADVGVILRGEVTVEDQAAGPAREQAIAAACEADHWGADVIRCAAGTAHPEDCLDRLSDAQHASYSARLRTWSEKYDVTVVDTTPDPGLSCEDGLHNSDAIRPAIDDSSPERTWQSELRHRELVERCMRGGWSPVTRQCLAVATNPDAADACLVGELDPAALDGLYKRLEHVAAIAGQIARLEKTPAKFDCKHVVDSYYADAKWHGGKPEERKQSRAALLSACTTEHWDDFRRACMIVDPRSCVRDLRWEYPALSTACAEYAAAIDQLDRCDALPLTTREALKQSFQAARLGWSNHVNSVEDACRAGANAVIAVLQSASC